MRRGRAKVTREVTNFTQAPYRQKKNPFQPMNIFSEDEIESIHEASLKVLCDTGIDIQSPRAVEILKRGGASVDSDGRRVRFEPGFIMEKIATTPSEFTLHGRNKERHVHVGGQSIINTMVSSAPNVSDLDRGRILGNFEDYTNLIKLGEMLNTVHAFGGYPVEPCDLDVSVRHLKAVSAAARLTTKPLFGYAIGSERMLDVIEIVRISRGINKETLLKEPSITTVVNANSPLVYDKALLEGAIEMAEHNQPVIYTPFTLAGAMAPITVAGALVQQNAEALAGLAFHQCVKPGAPAMYGSFTSNVDMKSGSPAFGTPENCLANMASGQMARRYNLPYRTSACNASNAVDGQAVYETQMALWGSVMGHGNLIYHAAGWLEGGLVASFEKIVMDCEMLQHMAVMLQPLKIDRIEIGIEAMDEVGPGGHFFGSSHTIEPVSYTHLRAHET